MPRFLLAMLLLALCPFVVQAQAVVRGLMERGAAALEQGRWSAAREACGDLNQHLYNSPFVNEPANEAASEFGLPCYADAQAQLGELESACRVYAQIDYRGHLERMDRRELCRDTANPAPPTREERIDATASRLGEQMAQMFALDKLIGELPKTDPLRAEKRAELRTLCVGIRVSVSPYEDLSAGVFYFCEARWNHHWGDDGESCKSFNVVEAKFEAVGMNPWPRWAPHTEYLDRMTSQMAESRKSYC